MKGVHQPSVHFPPSLISMHTVYEYHYYTGTNDSSTVIGRFSFSISSVVSSTVSPLIIFINSFTPTSLYLSMHSHERHSIYIMQCLHGLKLHSRIHELDQPDCDSYTILP